VHRGWVKSWRKALDHPLYSRPLVWHYFNYCLLKANHKQGKIEFGGKEIVIERGSFITGRKEAAIETGLSEQNIRTAVKKLECFGLIKKSTSKSTSKYSYITVCNYDIYQDTETGGNHQSNQQVTSNQPAINQQSTTNKNVNNYKEQQEIRESTPLTPHGGECTTEGDESGREHGQDADSKVDKKWAHTGRSRSSDKDNIATCSYRDTERSNGISSGGNQKRPHGQNMEELQGENERSEHRNLTQPIEESNPSDSQLAGVDIIRKSDGQREIFDHWNSKRIIVHKSIAPFKPCISARLEEGYTVEEIKGAIDNYAFVLNSHDYVWSYRGWSLKLFLTRAGNLDRFMTENKPLEVLPKKGGDNDRQYKGNSRKSGGRCKKPPLQSALPAEMP